MRKMEHRQGSAVLCNNGYGIVSKPLPSALRISVDMFVELNLSSMTCCRRRMIVKRSRRRAGALCPPSSRCSRPLRQVSRCGQR